MHGKMQKKSVQCTKGLVLDDCTFYQCMPRFTSTKHFKKFCRVLILSIIMSTPVGFKLIFSHEEHAIADQTN